MPELIQQPHIELFDAIFERPLEADAILLREEERRGGNASTARTGSIQDRISGERAGVRGDADAFGDGLAVGPQADEERRGTRGAVTSARPLGSSRLFAVPTVSPAAVSAISSSAPPSPNRPASTASGGTSIATVIVLSATAP
jgi:hypothetical protein